MNFFKLFYFLILDNNTSKSLHMSTCGIDDLLSRYKSKQSSSNVKDKTISSTQNHLFQDICTEGKTTSSSQSKLLQNIINKGETFKKSSRAPDYKILSNL